MNIVHADKPTELRKQSDVMSAPLLLTEKQAAAVLNISPRTLWGMRQRGEIRFVRFGRAVRYDPADLRSWIDSQKTANPPPGIVPETT
jgi:excisionase family DNA binding protein